MRDQAPRFPDVDLVRLSLPFSKWLWRIYSALLPCLKTTGPTPARGWPVRPWQGINLLAFVCLLLWTAAPAKAQPNFGYTIYYDGVGDGAFVPLSPPASTSFNGPNGLAVDLSGNLYIADTGNNRILKVAPGATTAAVFTISGLSSPSTLSHPNQLAVDSAGNLYVADTNNNRIVEVSPSGIASVLGTGIYTLSVPQGVAVDPSGNVFISDTGNHRIIELLSGVSAALLSPSGISLASTSPTGLSVDTYGNLYIVDAANNQVIEVNAALQGSVVSFSSETVGTESSSLVSPASVTVANNGVVYITDPGASRIAVIDPQGDNYDFLMDDILGFWGITQFADLGAIATNSKGTVYVTNSLFNQVWVFQQGSADFGHVTLGSAGATLTLNFNLSPGFTGLSPGNTTVNGVTISTAGAQTADFAITGDGCTGASGNFEGFCTVNVQFTPTAAGLRRGALVLSFTSDSPYTYYDSGNFTVPLFGIGDAPVAALSPGVASHLSTGSLTFPQAFEPLQTAYDGAGNIYVADGPNNRVLMIPKGGGNATAVSIPALPSGPAGLNNPSGLAIDGAGNLFIADSGNNRIVEVTAGTSMVLTPCSISPQVWDLTNNTLNEGWGASTPCDPNAPVTFSDKAQSAVYAFNNPRSLFIDGSGNLTVEDAGNHKLVQLAPNYYYTKDNTLALSNAFVLATGSFPLGTNSSFAVDTNEGLYFSEKTNNRVIHVDRFGKTSIVDFSSLATALTTPNSVALDPMGNLYVMDAGGASGSQRIVQEIVGGTSNVVTTLPYAGAVTLGSSPNGLAVDNSGNLLVSDFGGTSGTGYLTQIDVGHSSQAFPGTPVNASSSPQTTTVTNLGDQALLFSANPTYTSNFSKNTSDMNLCGSNTSLAVGISCDVSILFTPQSAGSLSATITVTNNAQNTLSSTQQVSVSGTTSGEVDSTSTMLTFSPTSAVYGQQITITATVSSNSGTPTGTVTFTDQTTSTTLASNVTLVSGVATLTASTFGVATHTIQAAYTPTGNFLTSNDTKTVTIAKASSGTALTLSGGALTATVSAVAPGAGTPTGSIQFLNNSTVIGTLTLSGGVAALTVTPAPPYSYTAVYSGDSDFTGGTSNAVAQTTIPTATAVSFLPSSPIYGQSVAITATVSSNSGTPTGTVTFTDQTTSTTLASNVALTSGVAMTTVSTLIAEGHTIQAVYTPTGIFLTSNDTKTVTITKAATSTVLTLSGGALTATVSPVAPGAGTPTGSVQFLNNSTVIGTPALSGGVATLTVTPGPNYSYTAVYSGDSNFTGSTSNAVAQTAIPTTTAVSFLPSSPMYGQSVAITATVSSNSGTPGGTVTFTDLTTSTALATNVSLVSGIVTVMAASLGPGSHNIQAVYMPTGAYLASNGSNTLTVAKAATSTALTLSGGVLTATVTAVAPGAGTPTGAVQFLNNGTVIGTPALSGGVSTLTVTPTPPYSYTAVYSGDSNFTGSTSNAVAQTTIPTTTTVSSLPASPTYGQSVAITATVSSNSGTPTGTVTFTDQTTSTTLATNVTLVSGTAAVTATALAPGSHNIQAVYAPTGAYLASYGANTLTITQAGTTTTVTASSSSSVYGQPLTFIATISSNSGTPTGTVTFTDLTTSTTLASNVTLVSGAAIVTSSTLFAGGHTIQAVYTPTGIFQAGSGAKAVTIAKAGTSTAFTYSNGTLTATVTVAAPGSGSPTGSVQFFDGNTLAATAPLAQQMATYDMVGFGGGTAVYSGDANFSSSASAVLTVPPPDPTPTLSGSPNPSAFRQMVTFTAMVASGSGTGGSVQFFDGATPLGIGALNRGQASFSTASLTPGSHMIIATYSGASASIGQFVYGVPSTVTLAAAPVSVTFGQLITLTAQLGAPPPQGIAGLTGQVVFRSQGLDVGSAPVSAGAAVLQLALAPGTHQLEALYTGDKNWAAAQSAIVTVTVGVAPTTTALAPTMASPNQIVLTASVAASAQGVGTPTGSVQFMDTAKNVAVGSAPLSGGTATATFAGNAATAVVGRPIVAVYSGDADFDGSTSSPLAQMANGAWQSPAIFAPDEIASLYGIPGLTGDATAMPPLSTSLSAVASGVTVTITDSTGAVFPALISGVYASTNQINLLVPSGVASGLAMVTVALPRGGTISNVVNITTGAPGIFTANSTGQGVYAGQVAYGNADGSQTVVNSNGPVNLSGAQQVYLVLYGTGFRHAGSVTATVNGVSVPVAYFGAQGGAPGVDQVNVGPLPASLLGAGTATLITTADGQAANPVTFTVQEPVDSAHR